MLFLLFFTHIYFSLVKNFFPFAIDYQYFNLSEIYSQLPQASVNHTIYAVICKFLLLYLARRKLTTIVFNCWGKKRVTARLASLALFGLFALSLITEPGTRLNYYYLLHGEKRFQAKKNSKRRIPSDLNENRTDDTSQYRLHAHAFRSTTAISCLLASWCFLLSVFVWWVHDTGAPNVNFRKISVRKTI